MWKVLYAISLLFCFSLTVYSQDVEPWIGLYARDNSKEMKYVEPSVSFEKSIISPPFEKPVMTVYVDKEQSSTTLKAGKPEFFFYFPNSDDGKTMTSADMGTAIRNYPFFYAMSVEDFILVPLFDMKKGRAFRLEREKAFSGTFSPLKMDRIKYSIIQLQESNAFKVELLNPLPKGEYGFIYNRPAPYDIIIYDFRIE